MTADNDHTDVAAGPRVRSGRRIGVAAALAFLVSFWVGAQVFHQSTTGSSAAKAPVSRQGPAGLAGGRSSGPSGVASPTTGTAATATSADPLTDISEACRLANLRQQSAVSAATVSLAQFQKHIDAMNLLVAGKISLAVATTFWDQTRVEAEENAAAFRTADKSLTTSGASCPQPGPTETSSAPVEEVKAITECMEALTARDTVLAKARPAVTSWEHHVHDMEMLRMGHLTPQQAKAKWRKIWKAGQQEVTAYTKALRSTDNLSCPLR